MVYRNEEDLAEVVVAAVVVEVSVVVAEAVVVEEALLVVAAVVVEAQAVDLGDVVEVEADGSPFRHIQKLYCINK